MKKQISEYETEYTDDRYKDLKWLVGDGMHVWNKGYEEHIYFYINDIQICHIRTFMLWDLSDISFLDKLDFDNPYNDITKYNPKNVTKVLDYIKSVDEKNMLDLSLEEIDKPSKNKKI